MWRLRLGKVAISGYTGKCAGMIGHTCVVDWAVTILGKIYRDLKHYFALDCRIGEIEVTVHFCYRFPQKLSPSFLYFIFL